MRSGRVSPEKDRIAGKVTLQSVAFGCMLERQESRRGGSPAQEAGRARQPQPWVIHANSNTGIIKTTATTGSAPMGKKMQRESYQYKQTNALDEEDIFAGVVVAHVGGRLRFSREIGVH